MNLSESTQPTRERHFAIAVWPQTETQPWRAELTASGDAPMQRFDRPLDLLLYLTELPGATPSVRPHGLR